MGKKLYVGNLSYTTTGAALEQLFAEFGEVRSAQVIQDRETGSQQGFWIRGNGVTTMPLVRRSGARTRKSTTAGG